MLCAEGTKGVEAADGVRKTRKLNHQIEHPHGIDVIERVHGVL